MQIHNIIFTVKCQSNNDIVVDLDMDIRGWANIKESISDSNVTISIDQMKQIIAQYDKHFGGDNG